MGCGSGWNQDKICWCRRRRQAFACVAARPRRFNNNHATCSDPRTNREHSHFRQFQPADQPEPRLTGSGRASTSDEPGSLWGLAAIHAFTEPGVLPLELRWQSLSDPAIQTIRWPIQVADGGYPSFDIKLPPEKGDLLDPELVRAENEKVAAIWGQPETDRPGAADFVAPSPKSSPPARPSANAARTTAAR